MFDFIKRIAPAAIVGAAAIASIATLDPAITGKPMPVEPTSPGGTSLAAAEADAGTTPATSTPEPPVDATGTADGTTSISTDTGAVTVTEGDAGRTSGLSEFTTPPAVPTPAAPPTSSPEQSAPAEAAPTEAAQPSQAPAPVAPSTPDAAPTPAAPSTQPAVACSDGDAVEGQLVQTRWGPVQVNGTIANGTLCEVHAVTWPDGDGHSARISRYAIPQLDASANQALETGSQFQYVSGATYTSDGYWQSLQSLLDQ